MDDDEPFMIIDSEATSGALSLLRYADNSLLAEFEQRPEWLLGGCDWGKVDKVIKAPRTQETLERDDMARRKRKGNENGSKYLSWKLKLKREADGDHNEVITENNPERTTPVTFYRLGSQGEKVVVGSGRAKFSLARSIKFQLHELVRCEEYDASIDCESSGNGPIVRGKFESVKELLDDLERLDNVDREDGATVGPSDMAYQWLRRCQVFIDGKAARRSDLDAITTIDREDTVLDDEDECHPFFRLRFTGSGTR